MKRIVFFFICLIFYTNEHTRISSKNGILCIIPNASNQNNHKYLFLLQLCLSIITILFLYQFQIFIYQSFQYCTLNCMIQLSSLQLPENGGQFYTLLFQRLHFLLSDTLDAQSLKPFSRITQAQFGQLQVRLPTQWLTKNCQFYKGVNYILMTQYKQIVYLPYLLRMIPDITIVATNLMYELARIHLLKFQEKIKDIDATSSFLSYNQEIDIVNYYEQNMGVDFGGSSIIYSLKQAEQTLRKIVKVNYYQIFDTQRGILLTANPSGKNNGSCIWELQSKTTKQKILLINDISNHQWRTCQTYNPSRLQISDKRNNFNHVIFTKRALAGLENEKQDHRTAQNINQLTININSYKNIIAIVSQQSSVIDIIPRISFHPEGICKSIFFSDPSFHDFANYCNSYVDYLSDNSRSILFGQSPDYPLIHYSRFKQRGFIHIDGIQGNPLRNRMPVKEIVIQSAPFVYFMKDYEYYLQTEDLIQVYRHSKPEIMHINFSNNFNKGHFQKLLESFSNAKIYAFTDSKLGERVNKLHFNNKYRLQPARHQYFAQTANQTDQLVQRFSLVNNELKLKPYDRTYILLPFNFLDHLFNQFLKRGIIVTQRESHCLQTEKTTITLNQDFKLKIVSSCIDDFATIEKIITVLSQKSSI